MIGSLQKKGNMYYVVFDTERDPGTGKRKKKWVTTGTNDKKVAQAIWADMAKTINAREYVDPSDMTVAEYLEKWLEQYAENNVRLATYESYVWAVRKHLIPAIGSVLLVKLKPLQIQEVLNKKIKKLATASVHKLYAVLREAIDQAIKWQICTINPCYAVTPPRREKYRGNVYAPQQLLTLLDISNPTNIYLPVLIATTCGLRRGEVCGLRWQDIDFDKSLMFVRNSLDWENSKLTLRPVKTSASERPVKLPSVALEALKKEKRHQAEDKLRAGGLYRDQNFCWAWDDGRPHDPDWLYRTFQKTIKRYNDKIDKDETIAADQKNEMKLPTIRFHDLRHSHATALLLEGVSVKVISERLGHSTTRITQDIYSHVLPQMQEQAADVMDKMFAKKV